MIYEKIEIDFDSNEIYKYFNNIEEIEGYFKFEYSCGNKLFYSDLTDKDDLIKYDGLVDSSLIRYKNKIIKTNNLYFSFLYNYESCENGYNEFKDCKIKRIANE